MKEITSRRELAEAVNISRYPVIRFNWEKTDQPHLRPEQFRGRAGEHHVERLLFRLRVCWFEDEQRFTIMQNSCCLTERFSYEDADAMIENARAPLLKEGDTVVIAKQWPSKREARFFLATVGPINGHVSDCGHID